MKTEQWKMKTEFGHIYLTASEKGLQSILWEKQKGPLLDSLDRSGREVKILAQSVKQLEEYFKGERKNFDLPVDTEGTVFQKLVWNELTKIPYGKTLSYSEVARKIKKDKAVRAVGTANGRNPLSIIVPCHRVIAADGSLGGYAGGLSTKTYLLKLEGHPVKSL